MKISKWLMYYPVKQIAKRISPAQALFMADLLGDLEYFTHQKYNLEFTSFMEQITSNTPLEGRVAELKRKSFRQRHRSFIARIFYPVHRKTIPIDNIHYLKKYKNQGICFPIFHFGLYYLSICSIQNILPVPLYFISVLAPKKADNSQESRFRRLKKKNNRKTGYHTHF